MQAPESFTSREAFAATWAHEQIHSTGHASRLDRPQSGAMGSPSYAREELVAELGAVLLCQRLQIGSDFQDHTAYLRHWAQMLREEPRVLFQGLSAARQAADCIAPEAVVSEGGEEKGAEGEEFSGGGGATGDQAQGSRDGREVVAQSSAAD